jgi:hypothetical protein
MFKVLFCDQRVCKRYKRPAIVIVFKLYYFFIIADYWLLITDYWLLITDFYERTRNDPHILITYPSPDIIFRRQAGTFSDSTHFLTGLVRNIIVSQVHVLRLYPWLRSTSPWPTYICQNTPLQKSLPHNWSLRHSSIRRKNTFVFVVCVDTLLHSFIYCTHIDDGLESTSVTRG